MIGRGPNDFNEFVGHSQTWGKPYSSVDCRILKWRLGREFSTTADAGRSRWVGDQIAGSPCGDGARAALAHLFEAHELAMDVGTDPVAFAVPIEEFRALGVLRATLNWLVHTGYASRDGRAGGSTGRAVRGAGTYCLSDIDNLLLTEAGVELARRLAHRGGNWRDGVRDRLEHHWALDNRNDVDALREMTPSWNAASRTLCVGNRLVRRFRWAAPNQEFVLTSFQEEGWPRRIDDPLPPRDEMDPKIRLRDTITCLNRGQKPCQIRFHGDGAGRGVLWELVG